MCTPPSISSPETDAGFTTAWVSRRKTAPPSATGWWRTSYTAVTSWRRPVAPQPVRNGSVRPSATPLRNTVLIGLTLLPVTLPPPPDSAAAKTLRAAEGTPNGPPLQERRIATPVNNHGTQDETDSINGKYPLIYFTLRNVMVTMRHPSRHAYEGPGKRNVCPRARHTLAWRMPPAPIRPPLCNRWLKRLLPR